MKAYQLIDRNCPMRCQEARWNLVTALSWIKSGWTFHMNHKFVRTHSALRKSDWNIILCDEVYYYWTQRVGYAITKLQVNQVIQRAIILHLNLISVIYGRDIVYLNIYLVYTRSIIKPVLCKRIYLNHVTYN